MDLRQNVRQAPQFTYPPEKPLPKAPDWPFLIALGAATILVLLGCLFVLCKMAGLL